MSQKNLVYTAAVSLAVVILYGKFKAGGLSGMRHGS